MNRAGFILGLSLILAAGPDIAQAKVIQRCRMCGMDAAKSQTEFIVHWDDNNSEHACCLHCVFLLGHFNKGRRTSRIEARDFSTGTFVNAEGAYYLEGSSLIPRGSMAPFLPAFKEKETADKYAKKYRGQILSFKKAMVITEDFDKDVSGKAQTCGV